MMEFRREHDLAFTPGQVWAVLLDFEGHRQWNPYVRLELLHSDPIALRYWLRMNPHKPKLLEVPATVLAAYPERLLTIYVRPSFLLKFEESFALSPNGTGTRLVHSYRCGGLLVTLRLPGIGAACDALEAEGVNSKALNITRLWVLTGCRRNEIAGLKWGEVDLENGLLVLDDSKTGKSVRPLCVAAATLLKGVEKSEGTDYVFPADEGDSYFQGTKSIWPKIVRKAELPGVTPHTLRHTVGATATSNGEALALTGAILGHANLRSTMIYAHVQHDPSVKAANRVGRRIASALAGEIKPGPRRRRKATEPIPIRERAAGSNGLLPDAEWDALTELAIQPASGMRFLASASDPALVMLSKRGFAERHAGPNEMLAWWQISAVGAALVNARA